MIVCIWCRVLPRCAHKDVPPYTVQYLPAFVYFHFVILYVYKLFILLPSPLHRFLAQAARPVRLMGWSSGAAEERCGLNNTTSPHSADRVFVEVSTSGGGHHWSDKFRNASSPMPVVVGTSGQMAPGGGTGVEQLGAAHQSVAHSVYPCVSRDKALLSF